MIQLTEPEKKIIKMCKGHYTDEYPAGHSWVENFKPLFMEIYGWDPDKDDNYLSYLNGLFMKLLDIHLKIQDDGSGSNHQLKSIFNASFSKSIIRDDELPIERAISELCGTIQSNQVIVHLDKENEYNRYELD